MAHSTDSQAKAILRDSQYWPTRTRQWGVARRSECWIRGRPGKVWDCSACARLPDWHVTPIALLYSPVSAVG